MLQCVPSASRARHPQFSGRDHESILGLQREADLLRICPCIPPGWSSFTAVYRHLETFYDVEVSRDVTATSPLRVLLDGTEQRDGSIILRNDAARHPVTVILSG